MKRLSLLASAILAVAVPVAAHAQKLTDQVLQREREESQKPPSQVRYEEAQRQYQEGMNRLAAEDYRAAAELLAAAAEAGSGKARVELAKLYETGKGVQRNEAKAQYWYLQANRIEGIEYLCRGEGLYANDGVEFDPDKGLELLKRHLGNPEDHVRADFLKYKCYSRTSSPDPATARQYLSAARYINPSPFRNNTLNYQFLPLVKDEDARKFKLFDKVGAVEQYQAAAESGDVEAQISLYEAYGDGRGAPQDREKAFAWAMKAAQQGSAFAEAIVGEAYLNGYAPVAQDFKQARAWLERGAAHGHWAAAWMLSDIYKSGLGVPADKKKAQAWVAKCAALGGKPCGGNGQGKSDSALQRAFQQ